MHLRLVAARWFLLAICPGGLGGCNDWVSRAPLNDAPGVMPPRSPDAVDVYASAAPTRPHVDVALLSVDVCTACGASRRLELLRDEAAEMGCDALFVRSLAARNASGTCIAYTW